ncbi:hypothetical protein [Haloarcula sp. JP-L23]|uniref:hypothetical protein n=1 Tax=Haloarcula sp. JP-L23 TaxID=2716717 RepID=UPI00140F293D|nr:hypothetical protein G9465_22510 [Haloarcula sp. JP-L23]
MTEIERGASDAAPGSTDDTLESELLAPSGRQSLGQTNCSTINHYFSEIKEYNERIESQTGTIDVSMPYRHLTATERLTVPGTGYCDSGVVTISDQRPTQNDNGNENAG